ncbi:MAG TPA: mechanosensitive ion channel family protein [Bacilli bacterium]|nr:mechanosensitive ion channel family protein [Bacilli bacterium]HOR53037.1 mechanosensitive ion channel family protein [Bacilli bacterium]HPL58698.1 mechanosensitive ion channel family protein [Bacilli bacterium]
MILGVFSDFWNEIKAFFTQTKVLNRLLYTAIAIIVAIIISLIFSFIFKTNVRANHPFRKRQITINKLVRGLAKAILGVMLVFVVFGIWGVDLGPMIAGAGVVGLAISLGAQNAIRDLVAGISMILDNVLDVGDMVEIRDFKGFVEEVGIRSTKIKNFKGELATFNNGTIDKVINFSRNPTLAVVTATVAYGSDLDKVIKIFDQELEILVEQFPDVVTRAPKVMGVSNLGTHGVDLMITFEALPQQHFAAQRTVNKMIKEICDKHKIEIPLPQIVVTNKK